MKTVAKNITEFFTNVYFIWYFYRKTKPTHHAPTLGFCSVPVATPPGVSLHSFRGSSVCIGLMVWGTQKEVF